MKLPALIATSILLCQCASVNDIQSRADKSSKKYLRNLEEHIQNNEPVPKDPVETLRRQRLADQLGQCTFKRFNREQSFWVNEIVYPDSPKMYGVAYSVKTDCDYEIALVIYDVLENDEITFRTVWWQSLADFNKNFGEKF